MHFFGNLSTVTIIIVNPLEDFLNSVTEMYDSALTRIKMVKIGH